MKNFIKNLPLVRHIYAFAIQGEAWLFDARHNINTRDDRADRKGSQGDLSQGFWYLPTRAERARIILRELPISNYSDYTFIDIGSGKGRMLLLAAELPFAEVLGVEMREELHKQTLANIRNCRNIQKMCPHIESLNINALDFTLPDRNLVLYFYNPFGREIMEQFFARLNESLRQKPRDVLTVMLDPAFASVADASPYLQLLSTTPHCHIYRSCFSGTPMCQEKERSTALQ